MSRNEITYTAAETRITTKNPLLLLLLLRLSPPKPPPNRKPHWVMKAAIEAKKLATVITTTSRFSTWVISWPSTASSSDALSRSMIPVVAHTVADLGERPIANALGIGVRATATRGLGRLAWMHRRST